MIDMFRHDLDREQTYMVLRALDSYIRTAKTNGEDMVRQTAVDRAGWRIEAADAEALRKKMSEGL